MTVDTDHFLLHVVKRQHGRSMGVQHNRQASVKLGRLLSAAVTCKECAMQWEAHAGDEPGDIRNVPGFTQISCPKCGIAGPIPMGSL